jgi:hypothetical protein
MLNQLLRFCNAIEHLSAAVRRVSESLQWEVCQSYYMAINTSLLGILANLQASSVSDGPYVGLVF